MKKSNKGFISISILVLVEQIIKLIINHNFLDLDVAIIPGLVYFSPLFNRDYSWINNLFDLGIGKIFHIIMVVLILVILYLFYNYAFNKKLKSKAFYLSYLFIMSGAICSLIDKVFWDGSLDYIYLKGLFTFDLKDAYISMFVVIVIYMVFFDKQFVEFIENDSILKDMKEYYIG